jgi:hypothetical protein
MARHAEASTSTANFERLYRQDLSALIALATTLTGNREVGALRRVCAHLSGLVYTETLGTASGQFLLNCTSGNGVVVGTGETVRFHVELPIPANATPGAATLAWTPIEPTGIAITAAVTITP